MSKNLEQVVVVDLDNTLCNINHRKEYYKLDWDKYNDLAVDDTPNEKILSIIHSFSKYVVVILTGREATIKNRVIVEEWLKKYEIDIFPTRIIMQPELTEGSSVNWKINWLLEKKRWISMVIDDRKEIQEFCEKERIPYLKWN